MQTAKYTFWAEDNTIPSIEWHVEKDIDYWEIIVVVMRKWLSSIVRDVYYKNMIVMKGGCCQMNKA